MDLIDNINMRKETFNSSEEANNSSKVAIMERVANFFSITKELEREIEAEPYASIIDLDPYLALELLKLGEDQPISRDAYAKGVAEGMAIVIEMHKKQDMAKIIPIQKSLGKTALYKTEDFESN
jgi:hypothetical protein